MNEILNTTNIKSLITAIEKNLDNFYVTCSQHPNIDSNLSERIDWVNAKFADWPSCIFRVDFTNQDINTEIKRIKSLIKKGKIPNGWTVGPLTKPKDLEKHLLKLGFSNVYQQSGMVFELTKLKDTSFITNEIEVNLVNTKVKLDCWSKNVSEVFNIKIDIDLMNFLLKTDQVKLFLGSFNKKVVSTLLLFLSAGVAGLHAVTTLSDYRGMGFGYMISRYALLHAYNLGYKIGVLQASNLGENVYRQLGFKKYCDINSYELIT